MNISELCIRRPVFTWVLVAVPVVLGIVSYTELGVDLFPKVDFPIVAVTAILPGASVEEMETSVTKPIEEAINTVSGVDELISNVREGVTTVVAQFVLEKNGDVAAQEIRDKLNAIQEQLPEGVETPLVDKFDIDAAPILTIGVWGRRDVREVTEIVDKDIKELLQTVPGVGAIFVSGGRSRAINVIVNTDRLSAHGLSIEDVRRAIVAQNLEVPGGIVEQGPRELILRTLGRVPTAAAFNDLIIVTQNGYPIRIRDIGRAEDSIETPRGITRLNGRDAVSIFVQKQSGTNTLEVVDEVLARLGRIQKSLPADIKIEVIQDQSRFVRMSMDEVKFHLVLAAILVSLTILLFIRDWRTTLIATMAIPTSIVPTFLFMYLLGFTLNNITMLALILAIGIVIDDAVVVHENIFRHMEENGLDAMEASRIGTKEISLAVLATSLSLIVIFLPVAFMKGMVGRFFSSFGVTIAIAITMSLFVSLTLTPMLCSRFLKLDPSEVGHAKSKSGWFYQWIDRSYGRSLVWSLRHRWAVMLVCLLVILSTVPIGMVMGANLIPRDDQSEFQVSVITPEGYTLERADQVFGELEARLKTVPHATNIFTVIGENSNRSGKGQGDVTRGSIHVRLEELHDRQLSQFEIMKIAREFTKEFPDLRLAVTDVSVIEARGQDSRIFQVSLGGPDLEKLQEYSEHIVAELRKMKGLNDVDTTLSMRKPEVQVAVDRERASDLGIPVHTIATTLNVLVGGQIVSRYKEQSEQYDVWLRADQEFRGNPQNLDTLSIPSPNAGLVQLSSVAKLNEDFGPSQINRLNRQRTVTILANPEDVSLNEAINRTNQIVAEMDLPPAYEINFLGQAQTLGDTGYYFAITLGLSVLFMYLILAAQFESWVYPVGILAALPVTIPFGLLSLLLFQQPMDLYAMFGLFMLIGIVKKNGILQVDKTNELRRVGMERDQAIIEANHTRLRPILMTTVMLIAAMVPIALGQGPGAGARASMAKVIIGGQCLSLLLALLATPVVYSILDSFSAWLRRVLRWESGESKVEREQWTVVSSE